MKYGQNLPKKVEASLDAYIERIKNIKWFKPSPDLQREMVDTKASAVLKAFGVDASIEYRSLKTNEDYNAARDAAWDAARGAARGAAWGAARGAAWGAARGAAWGAARGAAWGAARGAQDLLASHTKTYKRDTPFLKLVDLWELGLYPVGIVDGKFIVYSPIDFDEPVQTTEPALHVVINGVTYVPLNNGN